MRTSSIRIVNRLPVITIFRDGTGRTARARQIAKNAVSNIIYLRDEVEVCRTAELDGARRVLHLDSLSL